MTDAEDTNPPSEETAPASSRTGGQAGHESAGADPDLAAMNDYELRDELERLIVGELHGPCQGETERFRGERPTDRYLVGLLAPKFLTMGQEHDEGASNANGRGSDDDGDADDATGREGSLLPSSFGLTFIVDPSVESVEVEGGWARYLRESGFVGDGSGEGDEPNEEEEDETQLWQREPHGGTRTIQLVPGRLDPVILDSEDEAVVVEGIVRDHGEDRTVTLFLRNVGEVPHDAQNKDQFWIFQARLAVRSSDPARPPIFRRRPFSLPGDPEDPLRHEDLELSMRYRHDVEFAVGHGVAADWANPAEGDPQRTHEVFTAVAPTYEVAQQTPPTAEDLGFEGLKDVVVDMKALAEADRDTVIPALRALVSTYGEWIARQRSRIEGGTDGLGEHPDAGPRSIDRCERARDRIAKGIDILATDDEAWQAFQFANLAMWKQRVRSVYVRQMRAARVAKKLDPSAAMPTLEEVDANPRNRSWRIFQLAFLILNVESTTDLTHHERVHPTDAVADLLWFPTGGGKTEAYLGLAAYAIGLRRLQGDRYGRRGSAGVTVLMRYTLRLLTLQQFQRATALICATEMIRREANAAGDDRWGTRDEPFGIGLWVGAKTTPNWTDNSDKVLKAMAGDPRNYQNTSGDGSPHQLEYCPWCGTDIKPSRDIKVETYKNGRARTFVACSSPSCDFNPRNTTEANAPAGLPVLVVDEEIYRRLPTLLIATVDKFAQLPWLGTSSMLFGKVEQECSRHGFRTADIEDADSHRAFKGQPRASSRDVQPLRPPDLIIQDELHLISGPLGSMVGLYETAVDELCSWEVEGVKVRPKVVASTATIRNARDQVDALFQRSVAVFPPSGPDAGDDFFSLRREPSPAVPGRRYLGICAPGRSLKAALIRTYVAHLAAAQKLYDRLGPDSRRADPYMTLVGYFNSMRELGGMRRLVDGDVTTRLRKIEKHYLANRRLRKVEELTSRKQSTDIPKILELLEGGFSSEKDELIKANAKKGIFDVPRPIDVLLATSMISVGVDIDRLGAMVVGGQPKGTAEYIQASSRVGRSHPGLVTTVYNWARPRDLSHYERFRQYHATFYAHVEALSVTPFSARAVDKGLSGIFVGLVRAMEQVLNGRTSADAIEQHLDAGEAAIEAIVARYRNGRHPAADADVIEARLRTLRDRWRKTATDAANLVYKSSRERSPNEKTLLQDVADNATHPFACLNSLRDVEETANLLLVDDARGYEEDV